MGGPIPEGSRIIIVGTGLAGLELARQFELLSVREVLLLEAGPAHELRHVNITHGPSSALRVWLDPEADETFRRCWTSRTPPHYTSTSGVRQRLGGRSLYWHGVLLPIEGWALREPWWPACVVADLCDSWQGGAPLYTRVQHDIRSWRNDSQAGGLDAASAMLDGYRLHSTPRAVRRSSLYADRWHAYSPLDHWRDPETGAVPERPAGIRFCAGLEVVEVVVRDGAARGVVARRITTGEQIELGAEAVILAAGTIENSRLALQALWSAGVLGAPRLLGLADHMVQGVVLRLAGRHADRLFAVLARCSYFAPCTEARSNLFLDFHELPDGDVLVDLQLTGEQMPSAGSYVACEPKGDVPWPVSVCTRTSREDLAVISAQQQILQKVWSALVELVGCPATKLIFADYNDPQRTNSLVLGHIPMGVPITWSSLLGTEDHEGGTLPLGTMLDHKHEFPAIRGLFAAGPCSFPRLGAANPGLTVLALARRLAAILQERL
jgi:hypothetical protein